MNVFFPLSEQKSKYTAKGEKFTWNCCLPLLCLKKFLSRLFTTMYSLMSLITSLYMWWKRYTWLYVSVISYYFFHFYYQWKRLTWLYLSFLTNNLPFISWVSFLIKYFKYIQNYTWNDLNALSTMTSSQIFWVGIHSLVIGKQVAGIVELMEDTRKFSHLSLQFDH